MEFDGLKTGKQREQQLGHEIEARFRCGLIGIVRGVYARFCLGSTI